jgi:chromosome segregation ATPase
LTPDFGKAVTAYSSSLKELVSLDRKNRSLIRINEQGSESLQALTQCIAGFTERVEGSNAAVSASTTGLDRISVINVEVNSLANGISTATQAVGELAESVRKASGSLQGFPADFAATSEGHERLNVAIENLSRSLETISRHSSDASAGVAEASASVVQEGATLGQNLAHVQRELANFASSVREATQSFRSDITATVSLLATEVQESSRAAADYAQPLSDAEKAVSTDTSSVSGIRS